MNIWLWVIGIILQTCLLARLLIRRTASEVPFFTTWICFDVVRSALLFGLFNHTSHHAYGQIYDALSIVDLLAQLSVALELLRVLVNQSAKVIWFRSMLSIAVFAFSGFATWAVVALLPAHSPVAVDRGTTSIGLLFILLFGWSRRSRLADPQGVVLTGLGAYSVVSVVAQLGRSISASHRNGPAFVGWSYVAAVGYLLTLCSWTFGRRLQPGSSLKGSVPDASPINEIAT